MITDPAITFAIRLDIRRRLFPVDAVCACGEWRSVGFVEGSRPLRCYECDRVRRGFPRWEDHHVGGQGTPLPLVRVPANLHRVLSDLQDVGWRGRASPGSADAVRFDFVALVVMGFAWHEPRRQP